MQFNFDTLFISQSFMYADKIKTSFYIVNFEKVKKI